MEDQIKNLELFLATNGINSKSFYNVSLWTNNNQIDIMGSFEKDLTKKLMKFSEGKLGEHGFIRFNFNYNNQKFNITLT
jgi:mannosyltransferase OCH1-like enzyme